MAAVYSLGVLRAPTYCWDLQSFRILWVVGFQLTVLGASSRKKIKVAFKTAPFCPRAPGRVPGRVRAEVVVAGAAGSSDQLMGEAAPQPLRGPGCRALRPGPESPSLAAIPVHT